MASIDQINVKQHLCGETSPCQIPYPKVKLHYLMHYMSRGMWNHIVPKPSQEENMRIIAYICNICGKTFNNKIKKIFEGWKGFLCHYAIQHGKLIDAMKKESDVDMLEVLDIVKEEDSAMKNFIDNGTDTAADDCPFKICMDKYVTKKPIKEKLKCPHCGDMDNNKDINNLKLHIIHHYHHYWDGKLPEITRKDINCNKCYPSRRIAGANPDGCRLALICHLALQHGQLKDALNQDRNLPSGFVDELFANENVQSSNPVVLHSRRNVDQDMITQSALKACREKFAADIDESRKNIQKEIKLAEQARKKEEQLKRLAEKQVKKMDRLKILAKKKEETMKKRHEKERRALENNKTTLMPEKSKRKRGKEMRTFDIFTPKDRVNSDSEFEIEEIEDELVPEIKEQPYIRKRIKQNLKNICFDDDSDEDGDWEMKNNRDMKRSGRPNTSDPDLKILPKRRASGLNVASFKEVDSDEDWPSD